MRKPDWRPIVRRFMGDETTPGETISSIMFWRNFASGVERSADDPLADNLTVQDALRRGFRALDKRARKGRRRRR